MSAGYVYVLVNDSMPGLVKIGRSVHGGAKRAAEIYRSGGTGMPTPFRLAFEIFSKNCISDEREVHDYLKRHRVSTGKEFFKIDEYTATEAVSRVVLSAINLSVEVSDCIVDEMSISDLLSPAVRTACLDHFPGVPPMFVLASAISNGFISESELVNAVIERKSFHDFMDNISPEGDEG